MSEAVFGGWGGGNVLTWGEGCGTVMRMGD